MRENRPGIEAGTGTSYLIGGTTAANIDTSTRLGAALPTFLAIVIGLALILLTIAFRTILVPITSIIGFVGSVFAALGVQVAVFHVVPRIKEECTRTADARASVQNGVAHAARVVTAAALIMFAVFAAFVTVDNPIIKPLAFSLAVGVLLDAFLVRLTVVPATMAIIGNRMWYHPRWFGRYDPNLDIEGATLDQDFTGASRTAPRVRGH
ncbi:MMPL family transporter [Nocardia fusca]|uniref:MMPL family transporter n=1 Tax=Nocardia fusca TaxID=941183 RepID=A0ABV3FAL7_9NOCA